MKNRKTVIVAFLLVAAMLLGVGYAELNDTLTIAGNATVTQTVAEEVFAEDIYFKSGSPNTTVTGFSASVDGTDNDKGTITIVDGALKSTGDTLSATFVITNAGDLDATVGVPTITNNNETYFTVTTNWGAAAKDLAAGDDISVVVTVELVKTPVADQSATFGISFTATSTDALTTP